MDETKSHEIEKLHSITSVVRDFQFFVAEKWKIASDKSGSGNTANIGSINNTNDILNENGMFSNSGELWFDDYWMNYKKITIPDAKGGTRKVTALKDFVEYRKGDTSLIIKKIIKHRLRVNNADKGPTCKITRYKNKTCSLDS